MSEEGSFLRTRDGDDRGPSLVERIGERLTQARFRSPLHRLRLRGRFPLKLLAVPEDPIPGSTDRAARLKAGRLFAAGFGVAIMNGRLDDPAAPPAWRQWLHGWTWARDAATAPPATGAEALAIEAIARRWLERFADYDPEAWAPHLTGRRTLMAIAHAPLLMPRHDHIHRSAVLNGVARWVRHLDRATRQLPRGVAAVEALAGLFGGALMLPGHENRLDEFAQRFARALDALLSPDGAIATRSALDLAHLGEILLLLERFHTARGLRITRVFADGLDAVRRGLALWTPPGGLPPAWHGGQPSPAQLERLGIRPAPTSGETAGVQRLVAGETTLLLDAAPPPPASLAAVPHASTLAIALHDGPEPVLVSCGGPLGPGAAGPEPLPLPPELATGLRMTAAHSTLVLADSNSTRLRLPGSNRRGGVSEVHLRLHAAAEGHWVEARHDGWRAAQGFDHVRRIWLSADGRELRGEDGLLPLLPVISRLRPREPLALALRFHLAPGIAATLTGEGRGALLRLPHRPRRGPVAWSFRTALPPGFRLAVEESLVVHHDGRSEPTLQLVIAGTVRAGAAPAVPWALRRQGR
ncbi:heparinase II/III domain-containing protein [Thermaurantiacus sp.]